MDYVYGKTLKLLIYALFKLYGSGSVVAEGLKDLKIQVQARPLRCFLSFLLFVCLWSTHARVLRKHEMLRVFCIANALVIELIDQLR